MPTHWRGLCAEDVRWRDDIASREEAKMELTVIQIESAINFWRNRSPSTGDELRLCPQANALSGTYARMIYERRATVLLDELAPAARDAWRDYRASLDAT